ncbi:uncharacterized protein LOC130420612 isoform X2 [Triplophysa dalaica]|uniref:uncharacterized protein LOC130420612 isoform X2 n=1 Tax=Triplophysa dalaica TaxID=1582913 RepID=UPI0024DF95A3|nr:uncharacterized protein LOC130420612 isoform X2 [Triplophysa dalaica]
MDIRTQLQDRLIEYVEETLNYIETVRDFCDQEQKWISERKAELKKMRDIMLRQNEEEKLDAVLADTIMGLKELEIFLDAVEKLTVTSRHVFSEHIFLLRGQSPESLKSVIIAAGEVAPLLIHFKRNAETFFRPILQNVNVLVYQLDNYVLNTKKLCKILRQSSVLSGDIYKHKMDQPFMQLILNAGENNMKQMLHHLNQLREIRMDQPTRLAFLFQEHAQEFIDLFSERRSRMWKFLSDLEKTAVKLNEMKKGASISTVAGSSVGIVGGGLSIAGIILAPFTAGASLVVSLAGLGLAGISGVNAIVTGVTEMAVNSHHENNAQSYFKSYVDDMSEVLFCLKEAGNSERPLVQPSGVDVKDVLNMAREGIETGVDALGVVADVVEQKSTNLIAATEITVTDLVTETPQVAISLSKVAKAETLLITKSVRVASVAANFLFIGLDAYFLITESMSLAEGSESEVSQLIRAREAVWKSELEAWEKIHDSLCIGIKTISERQITLEKPFLP